eukprot:Seg7463.2 transcript_id=Seg7463.2/GoldUCD/mRNA.D3Y31 product="hypothetical protein" protein_id=Seg7463.2/GoldUCD/D3Y31
MLKIWTDKGMFSTTEKYLTGQLRQIKRNKWVTDVEWESIQQKLGNDDGRENDENENNGNDVNTARQETNIFEDANSQPINEVADTDNSRLRDGSNYITNIEEEDEALVDKLKEILDREEIKPAGNLRLIEF